MTMTFEEFKELIKKNITNEFYVIIEEWIKNKVLFDEGDIHDITISMDKKIIICEESLTKLDIIKMYNYILEQDLYELTLSEDIEDVEDLTQIFVYALSCEIKEYTILQKYGFKDEDE